MKRKLISTITGIEYPFERIEEFAQNGESLEVKIENLQKAKIRKGKYLWERFSNFLPFTKMNQEYSLGEGNTPLVEAGKLKKYTRVENLFLKNETQNPTWSFKDRGSLTTVFLAKEMSEKVTATISTGNMGHSISAYGARAGLRVVVFVPHFTPQEKIAAMSIHGATVIKIKSPDYSMMKNKVLSLANEFNLRIVSGNGPIRTEGYKLTAFEMYEQMNGEVPDFIAIPTSACGHIRGVFKGFKELKEAGLINKLPRMIVVQAKNNSPIVSAIKKGKRHVIPFSNFHTIAEAITSGNPMGGDEIIHKAYQYDWLAEDVSEKEILESQREFAKAGYFVEPASATILSAVKKLRHAQKIRKDESVILILTGAGLKDMDVIKYHKNKVINSSVNTIARDLNKILHQS
jgi:threonine synthase